MPRIPVRTIVLALVLSPLGIRAATPAVDARYATTWNLPPLVRLTHPDPLEVNAVRYRVLPGRRQTAAWTNCRVVSAGRLLPGGSRPWDDPRPSWQTPVGDLPPGTHTLEFDLRTPDEAYFVEHGLRVPQIARYTGEPPAPSPDAADFPQARYGTTAQDRDDLWFAWDRDDLYVAVRDGGTRRLQLDLLPVRPGERIVTLEVKGGARIPWTSLRPAGPHLGYVLAIRDDGAGGPERDLLLTGSGMPMYYSATFVSGAAGHDDQGPPMPLLRSMYRMGGFNDFHVGTGLHSFMPTDPGAVTNPTFDVSRLRRDPFLHADGMVVAGIGAFVEWARGREYDPAFWAIAEPFAEAAAREYASFGVRIFNTGYNEPELFYRSDRETFFVNDLTRMADAIRRGCPGAQIIAGKFSAGDPNIIRSMYAHGFRDNFDILDIHPYSNDPRTGCDMGGVVASHETLDDLEMGQKRIFLGEGWGPGRDLKGSVRLRHDADVPFLEADLMRQMFQNGYRSLTTPRDDYNPEWVWGARFFTLNDNMGSTYWKWNATPHTNEVGEVDYWLLSHLRFGNLDDVRPSFWDGGLLDFRGQPKGDWFFDFPPALPRLFVRVDSDIPLMLPGAFYDVDVTVLNADSRAAEVLSLGIRPRTYKWKGDMVAKATGPHTRARLSPGETWTVPARVGVVESPRGPFRLAFEVDYSFDGTGYVADDILRTRVSDPVDVAYDPQRIVLDGGDTAQIRATLTNNTAEPAEIAIPASTEEGVVIAAEEHAVRLAPGARRTVALKVSWPDGLPGVADVKIDPTHYEALTVRRPFHCPRLADAPAIDGDLADWPASGEAGHLVLGREVALAERPQHVPFPLPPPPPESALEDPRGADRPGVGSDTKILSDPEKTPRDFGAEACLGWNHDGLFIGILVEDPEHAQEHFGLEIWRGDSVQIAVDPFADGAGIRTVTPGQFLERFREEGFSDDDHEFGLARTRSGDTLVRIHGPRDSVIGRVEDGRIAVQRLEGSTVYEVFLPWHEIGGTRKPGDTMAIDILVNNFDGVDRTVLGWADAIAAGKYPSRYVPLVLEP